MTVDPADKKVEKLARNLTWYMTESKHVIASISLKSFNCQSISFRFPIKEI